MDPEQKKLYDELLMQGRESLAELERSGGKKQRGNMQILTTLLRLRQICCHPQLVEETAEISDVPSAKFELMQELLWEHIDSGHKVLLFSQFTSMLSLVRKYLEANDIKYSYLDGATRNRQEVVDEFNNSPDIGVFLLSLKAGGTGLNLTSADTVMIYDPWWNPATELQAADRTHRIGQTRPVRSIKLLVKDSVEEKILELQGYQVLYALITAENTGSIAFHQKMGYEMKVEFPDCGYKSGRWLGLVWMEKRLKIVHSPSGFPRPWQAIVQGAERFSNILDSLSLS
jgi:SNF2 family DNA or RNA helicase